MRTHGRGGWPLVLQLQGENSGWLNGDWNGDAKASHTVKDKSIARGIRARSPQPPQPV